MFQFELNDGILVEQQRALEAALSTNPKTQKALQKLIREVILDARAEVVEAAGRAMDSDPRHAAESIRTSVYKKILGGNINIYNSRKAHGASLYEPPRNPSPRGGNRRKRSPRTEQMMSYGPLNRGMVLRWLSNGTPKGRNIRFTYNERRKVDKWNKNPNTGSRGRIAPRNFFRRAGDRALAKAADTLVTLINTELESILNKTK